ncbi:MAG: signal recognition particle receptor subunit alpha, partial [Pseudomonadales bacterium]|nr:signal recognition particle receptor subunit alpha [Pseudomonadales bacterium]
MFESLSDRLSNTLRGLSSRSKLTEENIKDALREVRTALLEADVALSVVKTFVARIEARAVGQEVAEKLSAGETLVKIVNDELVQLMGGSNDSLNLSTTPPAVILMAGLQGAGKTTTVAKLAYYLKHREKKKIA